MTVHEALRKKYNPEHSILLFELRDATGFDSKRSADAVALSLYRTRGREITGFEIKHSRSDWLRELQDPSKAEHIGKYCDYFYLLTPDDSIAYVNEIPLSMGWMCVKGEKLKVIKQAERLNPAPLSREMLCSFLYTLRAHCYSEQAKQIEEAVNVQVRQRHGSQQYEIEELTRRYESLDKKVKQFEADSGLNISSPWQDKKIGEVVRRVMNDENILQKFRSDIEFSLNRVRTIESELTRQLEKLDSDLLPDAQATHCNGYSRHREGK